MTFSGHREVSTLQILLILQCPVTNSLVNVAHVTTGSLDQLWKCITEQSGWYIVWLIHFNLSKSHKLNLKLFYIFRSRTPGVTCLKLKWSLITKHAANKSNLNLKNETSVINVHVLSVKHAVLTWHTIYVTQCLYMGQLLFGSGSGACLSPSHEEDEDHLHLC